MIQNNKFFLSIKLNFNLAVVEKTIFDSKFNKSKILLFSQTDE